ncbi:MULTISPECIES: hypothetical protein [unclassified Exiguobacterium]|uniref:hypothetical protein n=1 Tax=unclassified Exiguobacterium TaxID=2644629 RepID=UPI001BEB3E8C|nr:MULTISPECIES: hypothetical protein [unclassified Exiguobacterium]
MNESKFENYISIQHLNNFLNKNFVKSTVFNEITKFHQSQLWFPHDIIYEDTINQLSFLYWKSSISHIDISNELSPRIINVDDITNKGFVLIDSIIETLIVSMDSVRSDTKSILPLLIVTGEERGYPLKKGCYLFVEKMNKLINLKEWKEYDVALLNDYNILFKKNQKIAVAFAIDLRRTVFLDGARGYRKALIDTGILSSSFKYELNNRFNNRIKVEQILDFADNALTKLCGLNIRLAPVISVQHIITEE